MSLPLSEFRLETERLLLRPWRVGEAAVQHELWTERDPRVPAHRRIGPDGRPSVEDCAEWIRGTHRQPPPGLLAIERKDAGDVIGYCGLIGGAGALPDEPELAYELLRRVHGHGYATEAAQEIVRWATAAGHSRLRAGVREWNGASRRVLAKLGFVESGRIVSDAAHGDSLLFVLPLTDEP